MRYRAFALGIHSMFGVQYHHFLYFTVLSSCNIWSLNLLIMIPAVEVSERKVVLLLVNLTIVYSCCSFVSCIAFTRVSEGLGFLISGGGDSTVSKQFSILICTVSKYFSILICTLSTCFSLFFHSFRFACGTT
jgi:hypothetical protein